MRDLRRKPSLRNRKRARVERVESLERRCLLATITVNTTADNNPTTTLSLRQAIMVADGITAVGSLTPQQQLQVSGTVASTNTINFDIPTSDLGYNSSTGVWTIEPASQLPTILSNAVIINGYSQPGSSQNTETTSDNAVINIAIDGTNATGANGLVVATQNSQIKGLDIEDFPRDGVQVTGADILVGGNFIGVDPSGTTAQGNATGVEIDNINNTIGGGTAFRNILSGNNGPVALNEGSGVYVPSQGNNSVGIVVSGNVVENNFIGIDAAGTGALGNTNAGVNDDGSGNTYGTTGFGNVISGNRASGIVATGSITIQDNFIGTNAAGTAALGNGPGGDGINDQPVVNVSSTTIIENNVVSGNSDTGMFINPAGGSGIQATTVSGNLVGVAADGTTALGNGGGGMDLEDLLSASILGNVVSANTGVGIQLSGSDDSMLDDVFQGNKIGTDTSGTADLGNTGTGISLVATATNNTIGGSGAGQGNIIAFNGGSGISIDTGTGNKITENSIFSNTGPGITLTNANNGVTPPTLSYSGGVLTATYTGGPANQDMLVEVFSNPTLPTPGFEQGKTFVGSFIVTTDPSGDGSATDNLPAAIYTATGTDDSDDTSEFSNAAGGSVLPATTTMVTSSLNPSTFGQPVTFKAVVTAVAATPTGSVIFTVDGVSTPSIPLQDVGGVMEATFTNSTLPVGSYPVSAAYSGSGTLSPSSGTLPTQTVNPATLPATTTMVTSSLNPSTYGQPVTFKAVVTALAATPTGSVVFTIDGVSTPPVPLSDVGGVIEATFTNSTLPVGSYPVSAAYSGSGTLSPSSGTLPTQTVEKLSTSTLVTSTLNPSTAGQAVTFIANVIGSSLVVFPTGSVVFTIDGHNEPAVPITLVGETGQAEFTTSTLTAGAHSVSAAYGGNTVFAASSGTLPTQTVNQSVLPTTMTVLTSSLNPSTFGQTVTFGAVVTVPATPSARTKVASPALQETATGTVTFIIDGHAEPPVPLSDVDGVDVAFFSTSSLAVGAHSVTASYSGSATLAPSSGSLPTQTVVAAASSVVLATSPNPSSFGAQVVLTATVTSSTGGSVSGTVAFDEGTTVLGFAPVGPGGRATLALTSLPVGSNAIAAVYSGDAGHATSVSNAVTQDVTPSSAVAPTVVALARYGFHAQPTLLTLAFSGPLDLASAQDAANYHIALLNRFGRPLPGHTIPVREAIYDPATFSVTLVPAQRLDVHYRYELTVNGTTSTGVRGASGLLIDGAGTGQPGSDYTAVIDRSTLAGRASSISSTLDAAALARAEKAAKASIVALDRLATSGELATLAIRRRLG